MKDRLTVKLYELQNKLKYISIYNDENGSALFRYSIEFESLLNALLKINYSKYSTIASDYNHGTQRLCELVCEFNDQNNKEKAFFTGKNELDLQIRASIETLQYNL